LGFLLGPKAIIEMASAIYNIIHVGITVLAIVILYIIGHQKKFPNGNE
jgi:hypothetical protein